MLLMAGNANSGRRPGFRHNENTRARIQAGVIISRLAKDFASKKPTLTDTQVRIGFGLLRKVLPDLQGIMLSGDAENPVVTEIVERIVDPKK